MANILVVEDQNAMRLTLTALLKQGGHTLMQAAQGKDALDKINRHDFDVVITDLNIDEVNGLDILKAAKKTNPQTEVIVLTGYGSVETAVEAMKAGAIDYLTKPVDTEELLLAIDRAKERQRLKSEVRRLRSEVEGQFTPGNIIATCDAMQEVLDMVRRVAPTDATVLVQGESGTGKELIARAIHQNSQRADESFIPINCGALPENLLESELFGHVKGAFTGASANKKGLFEEADGGTLFLDEIGEMTAPTQVKLLRVLQDGEVRRVGSNTGVKTNVRVIAATNQNLQANMTDGSFREDLYYRLQVIMIHLPALRERRDEILPLANHYLHVYAGKFNKPVEKFSEAAQKALLEYSWPGNIRELINAVERAVILARGEIVEPEDLALRLNAGAPLGMAAARPASSEADITEAQDDVLREKERDLLAAALREHNGDAKAAAQELGYVQARFAAKIKEYSLK